MKKSIVVSIINGKMFPDEFSCHSTFTFKERKLGYELTDIVLLHFVELGRIDGKTPPNQLTKIEKLSAYLKFANDERYEDYLHKLFEEEEKEGYLTMAEKVFRELTEDEKEYEKMEGRLKYQLAYNTEIYFARKEGLEEGLEKGLEKGLEEGRKFELLTKQLIADSRIDELQRAVEDLDFREKMFKEYDI